jgi:hypothetical protein
MCAKKHAGVHVHVRDTHLIRSGWLCCHHSRCGVCPLQCGESGECLVVGVEVGVKTQSQQESCNKTHSDLTQQPLAYAVHVRWTIMAYCTCLCSAGDLCRSCLVVTDQARRAAAEALGCLCLGCATSAAAASCS